MKISDVRSMSDVELRDLLAESRSQYFKLRMRHCMGQLDKFSDLGKTRKLIARAETVLRERQLRVN